jgi:vacuolar-type H+-ATPase subunit H
MSASQAYTQLQLWALTHQVEQRRDEEQATILAAAHQDADVILRDAFRTARQRVKPIVAELRTNEQRALGKARAAQATQRRERLLSRQARMLTVGQTLLRESLMIRWHDPATRAIWTRHVADTGRTVLPKKVWTVHHPPDWPESEQNALSEALHTWCGATPPLRADPDIEAGIRLTCAGVRVDGTLAGLLTDTQTIQARLLAHVLAQREAS